MSTPSDRRRQLQNLPSLSLDDANAIEGFIDASWAERGLAKATLAAYRADLEGLARWLRQDSGRMLVAATREDLFAYLAQRTRAGYSPRSSARL